MTTPATVGWPPDKLAEAAYDDLDSLEAAAYAVFQKDWTDSPSFRGDQVRVHRHPHKANGNRWHTYWHAVTEGFPEEVRISPIQERLERIPWCIGRWWKMKEMPQSKCGQTSAEGISMSASGLIVSTTLSS